MTEEVQLIVDAQATLGEGPSWDEEKQMLYWVDIVGKSVHVYDPRTNSNTSMDVGQQVGAVVPRKGGGLVAAMENGFYYVDEQTKALTAIVDPESDLADNRFNDGKCDASGRFWAGTMGKSEGAGSLYRLDTDQSVHKMVEGVTTSNGLAWSPDQQTMYYIDTPTKQVVAYDFDLDTGNITNKRVVVTIPEENGAPDGMTIDSEGMLWIAEWGGWRVSRWNPTNGDFIEAVPVPVERVTSCVFGGENLDELYITTASVGMTEEARSKQPYAGGLFKCKPNVTGSPTYTFGA